MARGRDNVPALPPIGEDRIMEEHKRILEMAVDGTLPDRIDNECGIDVSVFRELFDEGYPANAG